METWWPMCGAVKYGWKEGMVAQRNGGRERLLMYGETSVSYTHLDVYNRQD